MRISTVIALTAAIGAAPLCLAADYPAPAGYVSDFAGILPDSDRQALESKLRAYERATSIEVAVAIAPSLQGQSVDEYARGLFWAWGVGKKEQNNGVLFLWAPTERKVRIQVGYGSTSALTDEAAADILSQVTPFFGRGEYAAGVNAAVDGILARLGNAPSPPRPSEPDTTLGTIRAYWPAFAAIGFCLIGLAVAYRHFHNVKLRRETPLALDHARRSIGQANADLAQASMDLSLLRQEAPREVWEGFDAPMAAAPAQLASLIAEFHGIDGRSLEEYRELRAVSVLLKKWSRKLAGQEAGFLNVRAALQAFRESKSQAAVLLGSLPADLANIENRSAAASSEQAERLLAAARETLNAALSASAENPANWLLVHDLSMDVRACLDRLEWQMSPGSQWTAPALFERRWPGSERDSIAAEVFLLMQTSYESSPGGGDTGGDGFEPGSSSGGSDFGGFGGGDTGGGGASDSY